MFDDLAHLSLGEPRGEGDAGGCGLAGLGVSCRDVDDSVLVDLEGDIDIDVSAPGLLEPREFELAQQLVFGQVPGLALTDPDDDGLLVVLERCEGPSLLDRDGRVSLDDGLCESARHADLERERRHVEEERLVLDVYEGGGMDGGAHGDDLVRVYVGAWVLLEILAHGVVDDRQARRSTDQHDAVEVPRDHACLLERFVADLEGALDQVVYECLEFAGGHRAFERERRRSIGGGHDVWDADVALFRDGEFLLGRLGGHLELLQSEWVVAEVDPLLLHELVREQVDQPVVEVVAAQEGVSAGGEHLEDVVSDLEDRDVESAAAEVVDSDLLRQALAEAVGQRGRGGLVEDAEHLESRDAPGVLGRLPLVVVEVGRHRDDGLADRLTQACLCDGLDFAQDHGADFRR